MKKPWFILVMIGCLLIGGLAVLVVLAHLGNRATAPRTTDNSVRVEQTERALDVAWIATNLQPIADHVASGLHLTADQLETQLNSGKTLTQVAAAQGVSSAQLVTIELTTLQTIGQQAVQAGVTTQARLDQLLQQAQRDPVYLDEIMYGICSGKAAAKQNAGKP